MLIIFTGGFFMQNLLESVKENISFLLVCIAIIAGIIIVASLAQKFLCKTAPKRRGAQYVVFVAVFAAIAGVLMLLEIPLFFAPLQTSSSDVPLFFPLPLSITAKSPKKSPLRAWPPVPPL